ncbi:hypothetical protein SAMN04488033_11685 [Salegentibacter agarivorans]|uniref:Uncharacterized protein n=1 Tax=Salegentibacter agarivorans TaxID=345907 RepID=A0A1I2N351_9FLAO|nr:hypothetical protein [Salegentibacter agarivorans]SFF95956.1 hypothetical protein SAMN04488033_11685 [Salegentibacter agarivorans]
MSLDKIFEFINRPENDNLDYTPVINKILQSLSDDALIRLLFTAEKEELHSAKTYIKKEIERRSSNFPKS